jgi:Leucine-rich repeat (LRR) protein
MFLDISHNLITKVDARQELPASLRFLKVIFIGNGESAAGQFVNCCLWDRQDLAK